MASETILILGATSEVAEHYARLQAARGAKLLLVGRHAERLGIIAADLRARGAASADVALEDLAEPADGFPAAWSRLLAQSGGAVDVLLLAYGQLGDQTKAEQDPVEALRLLQVNGTSACAWLLAAARTLEQQNRGSLIAIGSVAGDRGRASNYIYGAAKSTLATLTLGLAHRFAATNVKVLLVKPGFIDTKMTDGLPKGGPLWATPEQVAADIDAAARKGRTELYTPWFWAPIMLIIRNLPRLIFNKMKI